GNRRLGYARNQIEDDLRGRREHLRGVVGTIDKRKKRAGAPAREGPVGRQLKIWIGAGGLPAAAPDVREGGRGNAGAGQEQAAHGNADDENGRERTSAARALRRFPEHEPRRDGIRHALEQEKDAHFRVVEVRHRDRADGRKGQQAPRKCQQRPIEPRDPLHSAALRNALRLRRSLRSEVSTSAWINACVCRGCAGQRSGANARPSNSSARNISNPATSSTSYHVGRICTGSSNSAARSSVCCATCSVLQAMSS